MSNENMQQMTIYFSMFLVFTLYSRTKTQLAETSSLSEQQCSSCWSQKAVQSLVLFVQGGG